MQDSHGDIYKVDPQTGKVSPMGTPQNPAGIAAEKGKTGVVSFANAPGSKYAIDLFDAAYDGPFNDKSMETINMANGETYRVAAKLMVQGGPDDVALATVKAPGQFDPAKLVFKTFTGEVWESKRQAGTMNFLVTIKPGNPNGATTLMALYNSGQGEPELLGKLKVYTYAPVSKDVVLVPVGGASVQGGLASELKNLYAPYGITLNITTEPYPEFTGEITTEGITRLSRYSTSMRALNSQFRLWATQKGTFKNDAQYLFFFKASPSGGGLEGASLLGDMPRGKQFGYLFGNANAQVAAHELGHGIFRLAHTFDSSYGYPENSTSNLMDYKGGKELVKHQWDILHDPGIAGWLDDAEDGQSVVASKVKDILDAIKTSYQNQRMVTLIKQSLDHATLTINNLKMDVWIDMSLTTKSEITFDPLKYTVGKVGSNLAGDFKAIVYDGALQIKIAASETDVDNKLKALQSYLFGTQENATKTILLFVNGYRSVSFLQTATTLSVENEKTNNSIHTADYFAYWEGVSTPNLSTA